jgi:NhaA family Na+:H+ antiporter
MLTPVRIWAGHEVMSPAESLIKALHPWVAFGVMPVFALANAGVTLSDLSLSGGSDLAAVGVGVGLLVGKPVGILLVSKAIIAIGLAELPRGLDARHLLVLGTVAGIGFTMALFIAQLAFQDPNHLGAAKLGILAGSAVAAIGGLGFGAWLLDPSSPARGVATTVEEAESSTVA